MRICRTARSCSLRGKGYGTCRAGAAFTSGILHVVLIIESKRVVQPSATPPLPAEATAFTCPSQMTPNSQLDPVAHVVETSTRIAYGKVVHPALQYRVNHFDYPGLRAVTESFEMSP